MKKLPTGGFNKTTMTTMKKYFFMAVAAIAALSSCTSDNDFEQNQTGKQALVFTATMEGSEATRATFDNTDKCAAWEAGDQISINGKKYSAQDAGTTTTFKADAEGTSGETYNAYFPADLYDGTTATLPTTQTYKDGKFNMPMYASSTTTDLKFKNLCAVLAITITRDDIKTLKSIKVASDKVMNGSFSVDDNRAVMGTDGSNAVVLKSYDAITLGEGESRVFYIAIPAQEYQYLNIFLSADGKTYTQAMATKKVDGLGDIARSKIFNINYKKNATKMWEGNLFIADCNVGATSLTGFGGFYWWGGIKDKDSDPEPAYCSDDELGDNDTASRLWGSNWRMPTKEELGKLSGLGTWKYSGEYGGDVLECTSTDYSGNKVTLPSPGYWYGDDTQEAGLYGNYWSSESESESKLDDCAWSLRFGSGVNEITPDGSRAYGYSVRAVLEEAETPAPATTGKATRTGGIEVEWVQLWENGPKFAVYNVGAENNKPEDFGGYYCWGSSYDESKGWKGEYYNENYNLTGEHDTATKLWGNNWRMPTIEEFRALRENCSPDPDNLGGKSGYRITGKNGAYTSNSIFLPNAGDYDDTGLIDVGQSYYWSSTFYYQAGYVGAYYLGLSDSHVTYYLRNDAMSVRAVLAE